MHWNDHTIHWNTIHWNDVIPMTLPMNMHLIKGTWIILSCGMAGHRAIPMDHWYKMVQLVPLKNHVIPMVLLVNMQKKGNSFM